MHELVTEAKIENLNAVMDFVESHIEDCSDKVKSQIGVAVDEIFSNIVRYAYNPDIGTATVRIVADEDITLEFEDCGTAYNPLTEDDPDVTLSVSERKIGGLGIYIVKNIMDCVEYRRENGKNILTIKKLQVKS